jgi:hypothetical protein
MTDHLNKQNHCTSSYHVLDTFIKIKLSRKCRSLDVSQPYNPIQSDTGIALPSPFFTKE